jgi:DNA invertase Pin-like site-specific DNA recombinase
MNGEAKISGIHRDRLAAIYLRQSSMAQVREHTESTTRQYGLAEEAVRLGWARPDVVVIDTDLGVSGRWGVARAGFTELVRRVCSGEVGAIFGIEISRLARSNAEVARLMEFAAITETLLIDADGVYDPGDVNDRMLLGMKSTIGEVELHVMAQRLQASKKAAAGRGELRTRCRSDTSTTSPARSSSTPMPRSRPRLVTCSPRSPRAARPTGWSPRSPIGGSRCAPTAAPGPGSCAGASSRTPGCWVR